MARTGGRGAGRAQSFAGFGGVDVARDHAAVRAGALHAVEIDAGFFREAAGERRGEDAVAAARAGCTFTRRACACAALPTA